MKPDARRWPEVRRAIRLSGTAGRQRLLYLVGSLSAVSTTLLLITFGLIVNLLLERSSSDDPSLAGIMDELLLRPAPGLVLLESYEPSLLALLAVFLLLGLVEALLLLGHHRLAESTALRVAGRLQAALYDHAARLAAGPQRAECEAGPERLLVEDCQRLRSGLAVWWKVVPRAPLLLLLLLAVALAVDFFLALYALLLVVFAGWVYLLIRSDLQRRMGDAELQARRRLDAVRDQLRQARIIAACQARPPDAAVFEQAASRYHKQLRRAAFLRAALQPLLVLLATLCVGLLTVVVGLSTNAGMTRVILLSLIYARGYLPGKRLRNLWGSRRETEQAAAAILAYLDQAPETAELHDAEVPERLSGRVRLELVSLTNSQQPLLQDVSLSIPAGSLVACVGDDSRALRGLAELLLRLRDAAAGRVLLDDTDIRQFPLEALRRQVALAAADGQLLSGTIAENIRCGRSGYSLEQVEQAAAASHALDEIQPLPHGFHTTIGPLGRTLGPYLAFRIGLARALLQEPAVLVIEEPPEPPGEEMRRRLDQTLSSAARNRTVVVLAARLSTLRSADRVYLFHSGRLHGQGEHAELLKQEALYRHLNYLWFNPLSHALIDSSQEPR